MHCFKFPIWNRYTYDPKIFQNPLLLLRTLFNEHWLHSLQNKNQCSSSCLLFKTPDQHLLLQTGFWCGRSANFFIFGFTSLKMSNDISCDRRSPVAATAWNHQLADFAIRSGLARVINSPNGRHSCFVYHGGDVLPGGNFQSPFLKFCHWQCSQLHVAAAS